MKNGENTTSLTVLVCRLNELRECSPGLQKGSIRSNSRRGKKKPHPKPYATTQFSGQFWCRLGKYGLIWCLWLNCHTFHVLLGVNKHTWLSKSCRPALKQRILEDTNCSDNRVWKERKYDWKMFPERLLASLGPWWRDPGFSPAFYQILS